MINRSFGSSTFVTGDQNEAALPLLRLEGDGRNQKEGGCAHGVWPHEATTSAKRAARADPVRKSVKVATPNHFSSRDSCREPTRSEGIHVRLFALCDVS